MATSLDIDKGEDHRTLAPINAGHHSSTQQSRADLPSAHAHPGKETKKNGNKKNAKRQAPVSPERVDVPATKEDVEEVRRGLVDLETSIDRSISRSMSRSSEEMMRRIQDVQAEFNEWKDTNEYGDPDDDYEDDFDMEFERRRRTTASHVASELEAMKQELEHMKVTKRKFEMSFMNSDRVKSLLGKLSRFSPCSCRICFVLLCSGMQSLSVQTWSQRCEKATIRKFSK